MTGRIAIMAEELVVRLEKKFGCHLMVDRQGWFCLRHDNGHCESIRGGVLIAE
jgi:hypothetical protein